MMLVEDVLFGKLAMPGETVRLVIAFLGVIATCYFDVFNKKNVPNMLLYAFLGIAIITDLIFFDQTIFLFSASIAIMLSLIGYVFYRVGQIGGADVFVMASIALLLPIHPSFVALPFNLPFVFSLLIFAGIAFALYIMIYFGYKLTQFDSKPKILYSLMIIPYLLFAYAYINSFIFSWTYFIFLTIMLFATIFFMMFKDSLIRVLSDELPLSQVQSEDVLALEIMNKDLVERYKIPRLMTEKELERLKATKVKEVWVYTKLPPFIPFILAGMILSLAFAQSLILT